MAKETLPKPKESAESKMIRIGDPRYKRKIDANELRILEGTVDDKGMRNITMVKANDATDGARLQAYVNLGYTVSEDAYQYVLSIADDVFQKREKARMAKSENKPISGKDADGMDTLYKTLDTPVSADFFEDGDDE